MARAASKRKTLLTSLQWLRTSTLAVSKGWDVPTSGVTPDALPENDIESWVALRDHIAQWYLGLDALDGMAVREITRLHESENEETSNGDSQPGSV